MYQVFVLSEHYMNNENNNQETEFQKYLGVNSSRHHYIPQFLINGFTDANGLLYIYDKQKDVILSKQRPPKSIFFETDRNTVELTDNLKSSILEDLLYRDMDNKISKTIRRFQTEDLSVIDFDTENTAIVLFFLISLFWRIPKTDFAADDVLDRSIVEFAGIDPEILKKDPTFKKFNRAGLFEHHVKEIREKGKKGTKWSNIHQFESPTFVIGDFPFLFRNQSDEFGKFNDSDFLFAVSSRRIYSSTNESLSKFSIFNSYFYNAAIIHQSVKYIASADLSTLKNSIKFHKELLKNGLIYSNEGAFKVE